jgi:RNA polymerase sigma-70 factor, ECF subfamily
VDLRPLTLGDCPAIPFGVMSTTTLGFETVTRSALLFEAQKGHRESLAKLLLPYAACLYLGALRLTRNHSDAEDARQDAFLKVICRLEQFSGARAVDEKRDDLRAWVSRIGTNTSIDLIRKRRHGKLFSLEEPAGLGGETLGSTISTRNHNPEERFAQREMRRLMARSIRQLAPDLRRVCLMRDVLEYSTQEVADRLGVTPLAVRLRLFRARRQLREKLSCRTEVLRPVAPNSDVCLPPRPN